MDVLANAPDVMQLLGLVLAALNGIVQLAGNIPVGGTRQRKAVRNFAKYIKDTVGVLDSLNTRVLTPAATPLLESLKIKAEHARSKCEKYWNRSFCMALAFATRDEAKLQEMKSDIGHSLNLLLVANTGKTACVPGYPVPLPVNNPPSDCLVRVQSTPLEVSPVGPEEERDAMRKNRATRAMITTSELFAEGAFKNVYRGYYSEGHRKNQHCVSKLFKDGPKWDEAFFQHELTIVQKATEIVRDFRKAKHDGITCPRPIIVNQPEVWTFDPNTRFAKQKNLVEPMIDNFEKFNSNTGYTEKVDRPWHDLMQGLSHFSYHHSKGGFLLCDLQGSVTADGIILTDPVIMSRSQEFGPTDLGPLGISTFFAGHKCTRYCRKDWLWPSDTTEYFSKQKGTTMKTADELQAAVRRVQVQPTIAE